MLSSATVRLALAGALCAAVLAGCGQSDGSDSADSASDTTSSSGAGEESTPGAGDSSSAGGGTSTEGDTSSGGGAVLVAGETPTTTETRIVSASNADGDVTPRPVPLVDAAAVREFVAPFGADLAPQVQAAVRETEVPDGQTLMGAVVAIGCDEPTGIELTQTFEGYEVKGIVPKSGVQCLVAVTSVALFLVDAP
ncbi:hypothetical protein [Nocardioides sp. Soil805]|uniref:hypothetical protein n=1 Tax=Nocardioides sp. Soil805 TaxID=1736416 RepID=UPI000702F999|nr:hypothetical protein [Nocardioides sp. Soil805]KRF36916.1 hypothetical protein ASG94_05860 [Nocardioides sp. Soil805]